MSAFDSLFRFYRDNTITNKHNDRYENDSDKEAVRERNEAESNNEEDDDNLTSDDNRLTIMQSSRAYQLGAKYSLYRIYCELKRFNNEETDEIEKRNELYLQHNLALTAKKRELVLQNELSGNSTNKTLKELMSAINNLEVRMTSIENEFIELQKRCGNNEQ